MEARPFVDYRSAQTSKSVKEAVVEVNQHVSWVQLNILTMTTFIFRKMVNRKMCVAKLQKPAQPKGCLGMSVR